jgi:hypothetical protein
MGIALNLKRNDSSSNSKYFSLKFSGIDQKLQGNFVLKNRNSGAFYEPILLSHIFHTSGVFLGNPKVCFKH